MTTTQLDDVLRLVDVTLGDAAIAVILHGSSVAGGLRPDSDLDLLVVASRSLAEDERRALVAGLLPLSGLGRRSPGDRAIELAVVARGDVVPWRYPPMLDLLYGEWERDAYLAGMVPARRPSPDLATLLTMARTSGRSVVGPPPAELLDPVPAGDLRRAIVEEVPGLLADLETDTRNVLLTLARVWLTLETGEIRPKDVAADFAIARLPVAHGAVMAHARAIYTGDADERWDGALALGVRPCAEAVVAQIDRLGRP